MVWRCKILKVITEETRFSTQGEVSFVDLTEKVQAAVSRNQIRAGLVHVFAPHATGIIVLTEYDWNLLEDIKRALKILFPKDGNYQHPSNAHSHLRSMFLPPERTLPIVNGKITLGTWQSILFIETDVHPRHRTVIIQIIGE